MFWKMEKCGESSLKNYLNHVFEGSHFLKNGNSQITSTSLKAPPGFWLWSLMDLNHTSISVLIKWTSAFPCGPLTPGANGSLIFSCFLESQKSIDSPQRYVENRKTTLKNPSFFNRVPSPLPIMEKTCENFQDASPWLHRGNHHPLHFPSNGTSPKPPWQTPNFYGGAALPSVPEVSEKKMNDFIKSCLEPKWPLFLKVNLPKQGLFQSKQGSSKGSRCIYQHLFEGVPLKKPEKVNFRHPETEPKFGTQTGRSRFFEKFTNDLLGVLVLFNPKFLQRFTNEIESTSYLLCMTPDSVARCSPLVNPRSLDIFMGFHFGFSIPP